MLMRGEGEQKSKTYNFKNVSTLSNPCPSNYQISFVFVKYFSGGEGAENESSKFSRWPFGGNTRSWYQ
jgi:hypothetical protein